MPGHKISKANIVPFPKGKITTRLMPGHKIFQAKWWFHSRKKKQGEANARLFHSEGQKQGQVNARP